jgi:TonB family protein
VARFCVVSKPARLPASLDSLPKLACLSELEKTMSRVTISRAFLCLLFLSSTAFAQSNLSAKATTSAPPAAETDRSRDGLVGPVRRVRTEVAKLTSVDGKPTETKPVVLEIVAYDIKGNKVENQYFPIAGATLTGKEVYKYDEKGNISEMTLLNNDGSLLSKETYKYEFDFAGNWNKMTTSVAVVDGGRVVFEPTEVTYRSIMYYLDANMAKMVQPNTAPAAQPSPTTTAPVANNVKTNAPVKAKNNAAKKNAAPDLPDATNEVPTLNPAGGLEAKTLNVNTQDAPSVTMASDAPPAPRPILKPVSGGVLNGTAVSLPPPVYPESAKRMRTGGLVVVEVVLDETGKVVSAVATSGPTVLRDAAIAAALKARFSPTKLSGQPVKVAGVINYKFAIAP